MIGAIYLASDRGFDRLCLFLLETAGAVDSGTVQNAIYRTVGLSDFSDHTGDFFSVRNITAVVDVTHTGLLITGQGVIDLDCLFNSGPAFWCVPTRLPRLKHHLGFELIASSFIQRVPGRIP